MTVFKPLKLHSFYPRSVYRHETFVHPSNLLALWVIAVLALRHVTFADDAESASAQLNGDGIEVTIDVRRILKSSPHPPKKPHPPHPKGPHPPKKPHPPHPKGSHPPMKPHPPHPKGPHPPKKPHPPRPKAHPHPPKVKPHHPPGGH